MGCFPGVGEPVKTFVILVVSKLPFPDMAGTLVTEVELGSVAFCICVVASLEVTTELLPLLSPVAAGVVILSGLRVEVATVSALPSAKAATAAVVGGFVIIVGFVWMVVGLVSSVGSDVAATVIAGVVTGVFGFGVVDASIRLSFLLGSSVGVAPVALTVVTIATDLLVVPASVVVCGCGLRWTL